jgi:hypothetical protein
MHPKIFQQKELFKKITKFFFLVISILSQVCIAVSRVGNKVVLESDKSTGVLFIPEKLVFKKELNYGQRFAGSQNSQSKEQISRLLYQNFDFFGSLLQVSEFYDDYPKLQKSTRQQVLDFFNEKNYVETNFLNDNFCTLELSKNDDSTLRQLILFGSGHGFILTAQNTAYMKDALEETAQNFRFTEGKNNCLWKKDEKK